MREKNVGKKSSKKSAKIRFLYLHVYIVTKKWGEKAQNNFSRKTRIVPARNVGKKIVTKSAKKRFIIFRRIS